jgi:hypothetical protein
MNADESDSTLLRSEKAEERTSTALDDVVLFGAASVETRGTWWGPYQEYNFTPRPF